MDSSITACLYEDVNFLRGITFRYTYTLSCIMSDFLTISLKAFFFLFHDHRNVSMELLLLV